MSTKEREQWLPCSECGRPSSHSVSVGAVTRRLCCACYVREGGAPADWHQGCMAAAYKAKAV